MGLTVNAWHYFGPITRHHTVLGVADWLLRQAFAVPPTSRNCNPLSDRVSGRTRRQSLVARVVA